MVFPESPVKQFGAIFEASFFFDSHFLVAPLRLRPLFFSRKGGLALAVCHACCPQPLVWGCTTVLIGPRGLSCWRSSQNAFYGFPL